MKGGDGKFPNIPEFRNIPGYIYINQPTRVIFLAKVPHVLGPKLPFVDKVSGMVIKPMMRVISIRSLDPGILWLRFSFPTGLAEPNTGSTTASVNSSCGISHSDHSNVAAGRYDFDVLYNACICAHKCMMVYDLNLNISSVFEKTLRTPKRPHVD